MEKGESTPDGLKLGGYLKNDLKLKEHVLPLSKRPCVMGILNITPDSFSDGNRYLDPARALEKALRMEGEGADIIDIGGESSRPGALPVDEKTEIDRVIPVLRAIRKKCRAVISVDTYKSEVARIALEEGAEIINDITALEGDSGMAEVIAKAKSAVCLMHMRGRPFDMQAHPFYADVVDEIKLYLSDRVKYAEEKGISPELIIVDPGIGFGKTKAHNLTILKKLTCLKALKKPIMIGTSRKSFIGEITGKATGDRIFGTAASVCVSILNGADIVRVHDVSEMKDVMLVLAAIEGAV